ncbi:hypothetical protein CANMA_005480 [Candida margitis]|uniref:uncharacterized protein n=1 Tax=Candida margitis TaxID=1775924 RepID=UPI002225B73F|nr:uncharacterized protein CANMA_005480 [Candida margitis]KAI5949673.1 hypothetical protein CANMA_005480 [Candida margitis]
MPQQCYNTGESFNTGTKMQKQRNKQVLSVNDIPPSIPAFNNLDLAHAVDTFKPSHFDINEMPRELPVYDKGTGKFKRFIKRSTPRSRVVSAPPIVSGSYMDKELPTTPCYDIIEPINPVLNKRSNRLSKVSQNPRVVSGPQVPPKHSRFDTDPWDDRNTSLYSYKSSIESWLNTSSHYMTGTSPSYQHAPLKQTGLSKDWSTISNSPKIRPEVQRRHFTAHPLLNYSTSSGADDLFSGKDEAWCYRDLY